MEKLGVELVLSDKVSKEADKAARALKKTEDAARKAQKALSFGSELERSQAKLNKLRLDPKGFQDFIRAQKAIREEQKKLSRSGDGFLAGLNNGLFSWASPYGGGRVWSNAVGDLLAKSILGAGAVLIDVARAAAAVLTDGFRAAMQREETALGFTLSLGEKAGKSSFGDVGRFAGKTAFDDDEIAPLILQYRRTGASQQAARTAFALAGDIAAGQGRGTSLEAVAGIMDTLSNIQLKGGVGEKKLVGMGVNAPEFYKLLAKKMGVTAETAKKRAESGGGKYSQMIINTIAETVEKAQGGILGTGVEKAGTTMSAQLHKLSQLPGNYLKAIVETPAWADLANKFGEMLKKLDPDGPEGQKIIGSLMKAFGKLEKFVENALKPESIDAFVAGVQSAVEAVGGLIDGLRVMVDLLSGETLSKFFFQGDEGNQKLADIAFKQKELSMGSFTASERKQREDEIAGLVRSLSPSERADFANKNRIAGDGETNTPRIPAPRVAGGGKSVIVQTPVTVNIHPPANDTQHTKQAMATELNQVAINSVGRAVQERGH